MTRVRRQQDVSDDGRTITIRLPSVRISAAILVALLALAWWTDNRYRQPPPEVRCFVRIAGQWFEGGPVMCPENAR